MRSNKFESLDEIYLFGNCRWIFRAAGEGVSGKFRFIASRVITTIQNQVLQMIFGIIYVLFDL